MTKYRVALSLSSSDPRYRLYSRSYDTREDAEYFLDHNLPEDVREGASIVEHGDALIRPYKDMGPVGLIFQSADTIEKLKSMSNEELAKLVLEHVWAHFDILSPQSDLIGEVIDRLDPTMRVNSLDEDEIKDGLKKQIPKIVCLCGSTRFSDAFQKANLTETLAGNIVLSIGCDMRSDDEIFTSMSPEEKQLTKQQLDELHLRKIDLANEVLILNVGGYIGESTQRELNYATSKHKIVRFLEEVDNALHT